MVTQLILLIEIPKESFYCSVAVNVCIEYEGWICGMGTCNKYDFTILSLEYQPTYETHEADGQKFEIGQRRLTVAMEVGDLQVIVRVARLQEADRDVRVVMETALGGRAIGALLPPLLAVAIRDHGGFISAKEKMNCIIFLLLQ
jgi:hypothetical protein